MILQGMIATAVNVDLYNRIVTLDRFDPVATEESMSIKRTTTGVIGAIGLFVIAVVEFSLAGATGRQGFGFMSFVASFAGSVASVRILWRCS